MGRLLPRLLLWYLSVWGGSFRCVPPKLAIPRASVGSGPPQFVAGAYPTRLNSACYGMGQAAGILKEYEHGETEDS